MFNRIGGPKKTIKPIIEKTITKFSTVHTDEYNIYAKLEEWGYYHKTVNHSLGQYAKDEDGDGIYEVYCNTQECVCGAARAVFIETLVETT
jgi:transposase